MKFSAGLALGVVFAAPFGVAAQTPVSDVQTVKVKFGSGVDVPVAKEGAKPKLLSKETSDVDGDGTKDLVSYFDSDGDGHVDNEVIDLGSTGTPSIIAVRCDADGDGRFDDWLVIDAASEEPRAALVDANDDGDVDRVAFADGTSEPVEGGQTELFRPVANN